MLQNHLKIALRTLWRNKRYTGLTIGGLAIGLAACLLMALYVDHEFSFDRFHAKADRIVRITTTMKTPEAPLSLASTPIPLGTVLLRDYPDVEATTRFFPLSATVRYQDKFDKETDVYHTENSAFSVFTYQFLAGNPATALNNPNSAVITQQLADKYFGTDVALGKTLTFNQEAYQVTGVIANLPSNTDLPIRALLTKKFTGTRSWVEDDFPCYTYVLFRTIPNLTHLSQRLAYIANKYANPELKKMGAAGFSIQFLPERLSDVHYSQGKMADTPKGSKQYGYLFAFLALFVLVIALLNYINLVTAKAGERAREVGVRKTNGARHSQLIRQFLLESLLVSGLAVLLAAGLTQSAVPLLNELLSINLRISGTEALLAVGITWLAVTMLGGLYPAFVLARYRPVDGLKGQLNQYGQGLWLRKSIIVFQFVLAVGMLIGVLTIQQQMVYLQRHDLGFNRQHMLNVYMPDDSIARTKAAAFATSLKGRSEVGGVTLGSGLQPNSLLPMASTTIHTNGRKRELMANFLFVDEQFIPLLRIRLQMGRNLAASSPADVAGGFLVNEAFVKMAGWTNVIGQSISGFGHKGTVVGVVKNFNYRSLHNAVEPLALIYNTVPVNSVMLDVKPDALPIVKAIWKHHFPNHPFDYRFLDESFENQYHKDRLMSMIFNGFAGLTLLVSCLGLFGLVTLTAERRTKEIGVRKVLGASVTSIVALLSKDFLKLVLIAILIASPIAYYAMQRWLADFAYRIELSWWIFALAGLLVMSIALLTVSFQSIRAALVNPVKSLRSE